MQYNWQPTLDFVWLPENDGEPYHCDPHDPGGATSWGVTYKSWNDAYDAGLVPIANLSTAPKDQLALVLKSNYWHVCQCEEMPSGLDMVLFNMAMMAGPGRAIKLLQRVLDVQADGDIGPITWKAIDNEDIYSLCVDVTSADEEFEASLATAKYFYNGWKRRGDDCLKHALDLVERVTPWQIGT